jgi:GDP-fucose transporter C1
MTDSTSYRLHVTATVTFYLVAALAMLMVNKWVLNVTSAPLFFLFAQLVIAVILFCVGHTFKIITVPVMRIDRPILNGLASTVIFNVLSLSLSNYSLRFVDASFYQVARGLILPFTVLTSYTMLHTRPSVRILLSCSIVTLGFFVGVFLDNVHVSGPGILFGIASSVMTAIHAAVMKRGFQVVEGSALSMSWYSNLLSALLLLPFVIILGEGPAVLDILSGHAEGLRTFLVGSAITGSVGFLLSIACALSIQVTSPITHMISSAVRGVAASILGIALFGDIFTLGRVSAIVLILGGSIYYTWVKHIESIAAPPPQQYEQVSMDELEEGVGEKSREQVKI